MIKPPCRIHTNGAAYYEGVKIGAEACYMKRDDINAPLIAVKEMLPSDVPLIPGGEVPLSVVEKGLLKMVIENPDETP